VSEVLLYSFRRCPYAMRARLALRYSGVPVRIVEVSLKAKPAEMLALSPKGTVPVLSVDGEVIDESLAIMQWALAQHDPDNWLLGGDPAVLALVDDHGEAVANALSETASAEKVSGKVLLVDVDRSGLSVISR
jgi:glutathione S-transferase